MTDHPQRRAGDDPREHWLRLRWSLALGIAVFVAGVALRVAHLIGEPALVAFVFLAGVVVKGESVIGLVRASKKQPPQSQQPQQSEDVGQ